MKRIEIGSRHERATPAPCQGVAGLFTVIILASCASANPTYTQDGTAGFVIGCSGTARSWNACYEKAGEVCGTRGYDILQRSDQKGWTAGGSASGFYAGSTIERGLLIRCK